MDSALRHGRASLTLGFFAQGTVFALLVTRIPALQERYGVSDAALPALLAAVPVLAGVGSAATGRLVARVPPSAVLRWAQPAICAALAAVGAGSALWQMGIALALFGLAVGALDASLNMLGVNLQQAYGRSIVTGLHAAYSLGGVVGAALAWAGVRAGLSLAALYGPVVAVLVPLALIASRWYLDRPPRTAAVAPGPPPTTTAAEAGPSAGPSVDLPGAQQGEAEQPRPGPGRARHHREPDH
ncbi:hypothetical protein ACSNOD_31025, partial [Streptomyces sp. URMC 123]